MRNHRDPDMIASLLSAFGTADPRQIKRLERKSFGHTRRYYAYCRGGEDGMMGAERHVYPAHAKVRQAEYDRAYNDADPIGAHHGEIR